MCLVVCGLEETQYFILKNVKLLFNNSLISIYDVRIWYADKNHNNIYLIGIYCGSAEYYTFTHK